MTWEERFSLVAEALRMASGLSVPNPEDLVANVQCNSCGRVVVGTIDHPPKGWHLGDFGENDYCPMCRA